MFAHDEVDNALAMTASRDRLTLRNIRDALLSRDLPETPALVRSVLRAVCPVPHRMVPPHGYCVLHLR